MHDIKTETTFKIADVSYYWPNHYMKRTTPWHNYDMDASKDMEEITNLPAYKWAVSNNIKVTIADYVNPNTQITHVSAYITLSDDDQRLSEYLLRFKYE